MTRCAMCGTRIKPWFETCYECYNPVSKNTGIPEPIVANKFMQDMGVNGWK